MTPCRLLLPTQLSWNLILPIHSQYEETKGFLSQCYTLTIATNMLFDRDYYRVRDDDNSFRSPPCRCIEVLHGENQNISFIEESHSAGDILEWMKRKPATNIRGGLRLMCVQV